MFSDFWVALATADFTTFSISRVALLVREFESHQRFVHVLAANEIHD